MQEFINWFVFLGGMFFPFMAYIWARMRDAKRDEASGPESWHHWNLNGALQVEQMAYGRTYDGVVGDRPVAVGRFWGNLFGVPRTSIRMKIGQAAAWFPYLKSELSAAAETGDSAPVNPLDFILMHPSVQPLVESLAPHHVILRENQLMLMWLHADTETSALENRLHQTARLTDAIEPLLGEPWRTFSKKQGCTLKQDSQDWLLTGESALVRYRMHYLRANCTVDQPGKTIIEVQSLNAGEWPSGLVIEPKDAYIRTIETGNPIADQYITAQCDDADFITSRLGNPDHTGAILGVVKGLQGRVANRRVLFEVDGLETDLQPYIDNVEALIAILSVHAVQTSGQDAKQAQRSPQLERQ